MPPRGPVVEVTERALLGDDHDVSPAVVVKVADGEAAGDARNRPGLSSRLCDVGQVTVLATHHELGRHLIRIVGPVVVDVTVGGGEVEAAVVVGIEEGDPETQD